MDFGKESGSRRMFRTETGLICSRPFPVVATAPGGLSGIGIVFPSPSPREQRISLCPSYLGISGSLDFRVQWDHRIYSGSSEQAFPKFDSKRVYRDSMGSIERKGPDESEQHTAKFQEDRDRRAYFDSSAQDVSKFDWKRVYEKNFRSRDREKWEPYEHQVRKRTRDMEAVEKLRLAKSDLEGIYSIPQPQRLLRKRERSEIYENEKSGETGWSREVISGNTPTPSDDEAMHTDLEEELMYLNDDVINAYISCVVSRSRTEVHEPKIYAFTTFFFGKYEREKYSNNLRRWTKNVDIFAYDLIFFPIHSEDSNHWYLVVADTRGKKSIKYYDSLPLKKFGSCTQTIHRYLCQEYSQRKNSSFDNEEWTLETVKNSPTQLNGYDCGVFLCKFVECLSRDGDVCTIAPSEMEAFREEIATTISINTM